MRIAMCANYNANLFELKTYKPLSVSVYTAELTPPPEKPAHFYQVLGRLARKLTKSMRTAVISDEGKIKVLETQIQEQDLVSEIELENIASFSVKLSLEGTSDIGFADSPEEYRRLVNRIVDVALVHLSDDYYKYSDRSPYILERGEGYFDEPLRKRIGIEDGRRFYRGLRVLDGIPHLIINREIELRSWKNLLNELKVLAEWWGGIKRIDVDFYNPPKEFVGFVNWVLRNRTANVKAYPAPPIVIREITWDVRAKHKVLEGDISPCEYHKQTQGIIIEDKEQPLVKWKMTTKEGVIKDQFHVPELLVVGHTFKDLSMRVSKLQISQVFDILHPHCGDQQRGIFDLVRKVDAILRDKFSVYPSKLEFSVFLKDVNKNITPPAPISIRFRNRKVEITPPYGVNFYRRYPKTAKFVKPVSGNIKTLVICEEDEHDFIEDLLKEIERRNECKLDLSFDREPKIDETDFSKYDLLLTITDDGELIKRYKDVVINKFGTAHQNITPENANPDSIPQVAMQITLKLGGYPWFLAEPEEVDVLSVYSYRNPFTGVRFYIFNVMKPEGEVVYQSKPFERDRILDFLREVRTKAIEHNRLLILMSFDDQQVQEYILKDISPVVPEFLFIQIRQKDELRVFSTYRPTVVAAPRRRRPEAVHYPIEAYEPAPEGAILRVARDEYYIVTTPSTQVGTYYRGCPTPIRLKILGSKGVFDIEGILHYILSLSLGAGTSGHETRLPAPLYYLKKYAWYINTYGLPAKEKVFQTMFYI